jgi:hypothetical protein
MKEALHKTLSASRTCLFLVTALLTGCATATTVCPLSPRALTNSPGSATITVKRSGSILGGASTAGIQDGSTRIGILGPGGQLTWHRDPGYVALVTLSECVSPSHVLIFHAEADKTYTVNLEFVTGGGHRFVPEGFAKDIIVGEWKSKDVQLGRHSMSDAWVEKFRMLEAERVVPAPPMEYPQGEAGYQAIIADVVAGSCVFRQRLKPSPQAYWKVGTSLYCGARGNYFVDLENYSVKQIRSVEVTRGNFCYFPMTAASPEFAIPGIVRAPGPVHIDMAIPPGEYYTIPVEPSGNVKLH